MNYDGLPESLRGGAQRYIEDGIIPGGFMQAVITNDLRTAVERADPSNRKRLAEIVDWFFHNAPIPCWGSPEAMQAWAERRAEERRAQR